MTEAFRPLFDGETSRFDPGRLRLAMVARKLSFDDMVERTILARSTVANARKGLPVSDKTAWLILEVLNNSPPMQIAADCVASLPAED